MKKIRINFIISATVLALAYNGNARENIGMAGITTANSQYKSVMSGCAPATAQADLDINNVRAKLLAGGDMWWDLISSARYYVPKPANNEIGPSSLFAGALWIGGYDAGGQLKVAAQTYRQTGNDFWPGPLSSSATIDASTCLTWDKFYKINRKDVEDYYKWFNEDGAVGANPVSPSAMDIINSWPAFGPEGQPLAPFYDVNNDGIYDPLTGDVPDFDVTGLRGCAAKLYGDQCLFLVFNDKGNIHSETGGAAIGLEVQEQAFAFATNDEINNMTFYKYKVINKSSFRVDSTYFGVWDDADLGYAFDDYVGCDVGLGLGMCFNGDAVDGSGEPTSYGSNPPAVGVDFFEGPFADPDGIDNPASGVPSSFLNYGDSIIDNERLGMGRFVYYNNDFTVTGNPTNAAHYYGYLKGVWKDATPFTYGGSGHLTGAPSKYMFPGISDPQGFGTGGIQQAAWDEAISGNSPDDRRFLESAGPFTLQPGAVNTITVGVVWARATQGGNLASVALLKGADAKAQLLFDNCFTTLNGPTAPNLMIQELDKELILSWSNPKTSNNFNENYSEDYNKSTNADSLYRFQGYQIYQLKDGTVALTDLSNVDKARLVFQCDKIDGVAQIVNYKADGTISALIPTQMVDGADKGIVHSRSVKEDLFATGDKVLVNHKTYYYAIIAYGYSPTQLPIDLNKLQDYSPYIAGRKNSDFPKFTPHAAIPHITTPETGGTELQCGYGAGAKLMRIEGQGNGGNILDLTPGTESAILNSPTNRELHPVYENGSGPVSIKVIDPLNVPDETTFRIKLNGAMYPSNAPAIPGVSIGTLKNSARWELTNLSTGEVVSSETTIALPNEQIINGQPSGTTTSIPKWGISVNIRFAFNPGPTRTIITGSGSNAVTHYYYDEPKNAFQEATMTFSDPAKRWLTGVADQEGQSDANWIRSGAIPSPAPPATAWDDLPGSLDNIQAYEKVLGGTWAPYRLCASTPTTVPNPIKYKAGPGWGAFQTLNKLENLASVDVVITSDASLWTRCPVIELQEEAILAIGGARKMDMRKSPSVDKAGRKAGDTDYNAAEGDLNGTTGMGWFPGYAINIETGERLNMAFGEDSWLASENGADMKWNPTSNWYSQPAFEPLFGGKHYIYVFGHNGDKKYNSTDTYLPDALRDIPLYDQGKVLNKLFTTVATQGMGATISDGYKREIYADAMWVNMPILMGGHSLLESDVRIRLRVTKAYQLYGTGNEVSSGNLIQGQTYYVQNGPVTHNGVTVQTGSSFTAVGSTYTSSITNPSVLSTAYNALPYPAYEFNTTDIATHKNVAEVMKSALDLINIVPNPYYAYSAYESNAGENIVKITNLPEICTVSIYTLNGTLIRKLKKDGDITSIDWDLKNQARIPVASGMYLVHVYVPGVGEKILKWFGVMRPIDLEAY